MLDCALGGGWVRGRIANIVGDRSTGKTLLAIEACANVAQMYPKADIWYRERESAFDKPYAQALGMPLDRIDFGRDNFHTVEGFAADLQACIEKTKHGGLYILDSLDSLTDDAELKRKFGEASYGMGKAKNMSEMFRRLVRDLEEKQITLMIISQVRDAIGVTFGQKHKRTGGRALDFYATHVVYLAHVGRVTREIQKIKRVVGVDIKAKVEKNKVGLPFREAEFEIKFGYGIEDFQSCVDWLKLVERLPAIDIKPAEFNKFLTDSYKLPDHQFRGLCQEVAEATRKVWRDVETRFLPTRQKYGNAA